MTAVPHTLDGTTPCTDCPQSASVWVKNNGDCYLPICTDCLPKYLVWHSAVQELRDLGFDLAGTVADDSPLTSEELRELERKP